MNNKYFILRHGQTIYQAEERGIVYPWPESSPILLTEKGVEDVKKSAKELKKEKIDLIYSSDASRTRQTAEIVGQELEVKVILDPRLRDIDSGFFNGRPQEELFQFFSNPEEEFYKRPPQGENRSDVKERMMNLLKEIDEKYNNKKILIVSHKGPLRLLEGAVKGLTNKEISEAKQMGLSTAQFRELKE
jgi:broad specificity phosphatase PhoE